MTEKLKPCPFCGCDSISEQSIHGGYGVICENCFTEVAEYPTREEVYTHWNTRVVDKDILDVLISCYAYLCAAQLWKIQTGLLTDEEDKLISRLEKVLKEIDPEARAND